MSGFNCIHLVFNIVNNDYQQDLESCIHLFLMDHLVIYSIFYLKILYFYIETFTLKYGLTDQNSKPLEWFNKHYFSYSLERDTQKTDTKN